MVREVDKVTNAVCENGRTILNVTLEPGEVAMYVLNPNEEAVYEESAGQTTELELTGWNLTVDSTPPGTKRNAQKKTLKPALLLQK